MSDERRTILAAAADEFAEVGLVDSSVESVAARADVEPGVVRALYVDKQTLLREVLRLETDPLVSGISVAVADIDDPRELVRASLRMYDQFLFDNPTVVRLFTRCILDGPDSLEKLYKQSLFPSEFYDRLLEIINKGQLRCKDVLVLTLLFDSLILLPHMIRSAVVLMRPGVSVEATFEARFDPTIDLFENGLYTT